MTGAYSFRPAWRRNIWIALFVFWVLGLVALAAVSCWLVVGIVVGTGVLLLLCLVSEFVSAFTQVLGAVVLPWLCLFGFNLILHAALGDDHRPGLVFGLVLAIVVFAIVATGYLLIWKEGNCAALIVAATLASVNVIGVALLSAALHKHGPVAAPERIVSQLDAAIVVPAGGGTLPAPGTPSRQSDLDVQYSVGRFDSARVHWQPPGAPKWRDSADHVILLDVDGTPADVPNPAKLRSVNRSTNETAEIARWLRTARAINPKAFIAVLLQTSDQHRKDAWTSAVGDNGSVASVQELGSKTLTDAAVTLATEAPDASEVLTLAKRFRPVLLFNSKEEHFTPLEINAFLSTRVELCHDDRVTGSKCDKVQKSSDLVNGATHLNITKRDLTKPEPPSAIYVHPSAATEGVRKLLYLDYWWYLDDNPAPQGRGISCGPGLALPGLSCFDHVSDWEGITVVLDRTGPEAKVVALQYAEHKQRVRYDYAQLRSYWADHEKHDARWARLHRNIDQIDDLDRRPLAFIADGSHAAYAVPCPPNCGQVATGLTDYDRDGIRSWPANVTADCTTTACVRLLPTRNGGKDAALWNAFQGVWGDRKCILNGGYCTAEESPGAPGTQPRYKHPTQVDGYVDYVNRKWKFHKCEDGSCAKLPLPGA